MALKCKRNAIIVSHEANGIKTAIEKRMKSSEGGANDLERGKNDEEEKEEEMEDEPSFEYGLQN